MERACRLLEEIGAGRVARAVDRRCRHTPRGSVRPAPPRAHCPRARLRRRPPARSSASCVRSASRSSPRRRVIPATRLRPCHGRSIVPSWRVDVPREVDLIEEVARHPRLRRAAVDLPGADDGAAPARPAHGAARGCAASARAIGFSEAVTFSFIERDGGRALRRSRRPRHHRQPALRELRGAAALAAARPGRRVAHNRRREQRDVRLFEIGNRFTRDRRRAPGAGLAWTGGASDAALERQARAADIFDLTGRCRHCARVVGLEASFTPRAVRVPDRGAPAAPSRSAGAARRAVSRARIGTLGQLAPASGRSRRAAARASRCSSPRSISTRSREWADLGDRVRAVPLPRYPSSVPRSVDLVPLGLPAADIRGTIREAAPPSLVRVQEFDRYQGRGVPDGAVQRVAAPDVPGRRTAR